MRFVFADDSSSEYGGQGHVLVCIVGIVIDADALVGLEDTLLRIAGRHLIPHGQRGKSISGGEGARRLLDEPIHCRHDMEHEATVKLCDEVLNYIAYANIRLVASAVWLEGPPGTRDREANIRASYSFLRGLDSEMLRIGERAQLVWSADKPAPWAKNHSGQAYDECSAESLENACNAEPGRNQCSGQPGKKQRNGEPVNNQCNGEPGKNQSNAKQWQRYLRAVRTANGSSLQFALQNLLWSQSERSQLYEVDEEGKKLDRLKIPHYDVPLRGIRDWMYAQFPYGTFIHQVADLVAYNVRQYLLSFATGQECKYWTPNLRKTLSFLMTRCLGLYSYTEEEQEHRAVALTWSDPRLLKWPPRACGRTRLNEFLQGFGEQQGKRIP